MSLIDYETGKIIYKPKDENEKPDVKPDPNYQMPPLKWYPKINAEERK